MIRTIRTAAAALATAAVASPALAFESSRADLGTFRSADPAFMRFVEETAANAAPFAPLALVLVFGLYVLAENRLFSAR